MKLETQEWIEKAEGDLKALLEEQIVVFRKTHDLVELLDLSGGQLPELDSLRTKLIHLSMFGITSRYPGVRATQQAADEALHTAEAVRRVVRPKLGFSES